MTNNPAGSAPPLTALRPVPKPMAWRRTGRRAKTIEWTDKAVSDEVAHFLSSGIPDRAFILLETLRDFLAVTEGRLYQLCQRVSDAQYRSFGIRLNELQQRGLIELASTEVASADIAAAGVTPYIAGNRRELRVWTLGPVGVALSNRLWDLRFAPIGSTEHVAHHALAAEMLFRFQAAATAAGRNYEVFGPRRLAVVRQDAETGKAFVVNSPDGLLVRRNAAGEVDASFVVEFHNEDRVGRAKSKIEVYDKLLNDPEQLWRGAWGLFPSFPKVMVVWRHAAVLTDYENQLKTLAMARRNKWKGDQNLAQFRQLPLAEALYGSPLRFTAMGDDAPKRPAGNPPPTPNAQTTPPTPVKEGAR